MLSYFDKPSDMEEQEFLKASNESVSSTPSMPFDVQDPDMSTQPPCQHNEESNSELEEKLVELRSHLFSIKSERLESKHNHQLYVQKSKERRELLKREYKSHATSVEPYREIFLRQREEGDSQEILDLKVSLCYKVHRMEIDGELLDMYKTQCTQLIESLREEIDLQHQHLEDMEERLEDAIENVEIHIAKIRDRHIRLMHQHLQALKKLQRRAQSSYYFNTLLPSAMIPPSLVATMSLDSVATSAFSYFQSSTNVSSSQSAKTTTAPTKQDSFSSQSSLSNSLSNSFSSYMGRRGSSGRNVPMSLME